MIPTPEISFRLPLEKVILKHNEPPQSITHTDISSGISVTITAVAHTPKPKGYWFKVEPNKHFSNAGSTPMLFPPPSLLVSQSKLCEMSMQEVFDSNECKAFSCRVMHCKDSGFHQLSSVEVVNSDGDVVSTAHLLQRGALPSREQIKSSQVGVYIKDLRKFCTVNEKEERAMLIRGQKDWGICIGSWKDSFSIKFFSVLGEQKRLENVYRQNPHGDKFSVGDWLRLSVDLREGIITVPPKVSYVPESIALGFAIAILRLLCQPKVILEDPNCFCEKSNHRENTKNLKLAVAAGFFASALPTCITQRGTCNKCLNFRRQISQLKSNRTNYYDSSTSNYKRNDHRFSFGGVGGGGIGGCGGGGGGGGCGGGC